MSLFKKLIYRVTNTYRQILEINKNSYAKLQLCGTEEEMREVAGKICRKYLHGAWKTVAPADLYFSRISGGLSNFLYMVGLPDEPSKFSDYQLRDSSPDEDTVLNRKRSFSFTTEEPRKVLLRIYGQAHGERAMDAIVTESVIFTLLSERKLGPKLHGVFSGGRIEEYIPARSLVTKELTDPAISMKIAEKMAAVHSMAVPLSKDPDWIWKTSYKWLKTVKEELQSGVKGKNEEEDKCIEKIKSVDFDKELTWLKKYLATVNSPVVFCHNDMQRGNILLFDDSVPGQSDCESYASYGQTYDSEQRSFKDIYADEFNTSDSISSRLSDSGEPRIVLIDFEYCAYNHRGFDIANHFQEWAFDYTNPEPPYYHCNMDDLPTLEQKEIFIKEYLKHYHMNVTEGSSDPPTLDEINQLLAEVDAYSLSCNLLWTLWSCVNAFKSKITFGYWDYALKRLDNYYRLKQEMIKKGNSVAQKRKICEVDI